MAAELLPDALWEEIEPLLPSLYKYSVHTFARCFPTRTHAATRHP